MKKKFIINLSLLILLNLLIKPFWVFGIDLSVQNIVGAQEYGFYFSLLNFSLLFNIILDLGITNFNNRGISQNPELLKEYFSNIVVVKFVLAIAYGILSISIALLLGYELRHFSVLVFLVLNQFLISFMLYLRSNISGLQFFTTDSLLSVLDRALMIILCSLALWGNVFHQKFRIEHFVYIQTISYVLATAAIYFVFRYKAGPVRFLFRRSKALELFKRSFPFALLALLMSFYTRADGILLERLLPDGSYDAGIYAQSYRILDALSNFSVLFAALLLPMFSKMIGSKENILPLLRLSFLIMMVLSVALVVSCSVYNENLIKALYHEDNDYSIRVFRWLILSFLPVAATYILGTLLTANGNLKHLNYIAFGGVLINIGLNLALIPLFKAQGAALANLTTQMFVVLAQIYVFLKLWNVRLQKPEIFKFILFLLLAVLSTIATTFLPFFWLVSFMISLALICLMSFVSGTVDVKEIIAAIRLQLRRMAV